MSAAKRVAHAAETVRARWEQQVSTDPQTEAAQALEDTGQLLDPEVAAELVAFRKGRELAVVVAKHGAFPMPVGSQPQALSVEREQEIRSLDLLALMSDRAAPVVSGHLTALLDEVTRLRAERAEIGDEVARFGIFGAALPATRALVKRADELVTENAELRAQVAALLKERHSTNEAPDDAAQELRANREGPALPWAASMDDGDLSMFLDDLVSAAMGRWQSDPEVPDREVLAAVEKACADWRTPGEGYRSDPEPDGCECPPEVPPTPHQVGCFFDGVPVSPPSERSVSGPLKGVARLNASAAAAAEATHWKRLGMEDPHDGPLARSYQIPHDLPEGCRLSEEQVRELGQPFLDGGA